MFQLDRDHIVVCFISPALSVDGWSSDFHNGQKPRIAYVSSTNVPFFV